MSVDVYYDSPGLFSAQDPRTAIAILSESQQGYLVRHSFMGMYGGQQLPPYATLVGRDAILMMGTTSDLQNDIHWTISYQLTWINIPNDYLSIWYVRRSTMDKTKTVVSVAPLQSYWGNTQNPENRGWRNLYPNQVLNGGISLQTLKDTILPTVQGSRGWF